MHAEIGTPVNRKSNRNSHKYLDFIWLINIAYLKLKLGLN